MSSIQLFLFVFLFFLFFVFGAIVDVYASQAAEFPPKRKLPWWVSDLFHIWWLLLVIGVLPIGIVLVATGFNPLPLKVWIAAGPTFSVIWDLIFSKLWSGKWISDSCTSWLRIKWKGKVVLNIGFSEKTIGWFHLARLGTTLFLVWLFFL